MQHYYLSNDGQTAGPFLLTDLPSQGLTSSSFIWHEGLATWQVATDVPEVAALLPRPTARPVPPPPPAAASYIPTAPVYEPAYVSTTSSSSSGLSAVFAKNPAAWITGTLALLLVSFVGFSQYSNNNSPDYTAEALATAATDSAAGPSEQEQLQAQAEELRREKQRLWNREHFMEYVQADVLPGYRVLGFGGIADGHVQFTNNSGYKVRDVVMAVEYIKADGDTYKVEYVTLEEVPAHESRTVEVPESSRGTSLRCSIQRLRTPGLEFQYSL